VSETDLANDISIEIFLLAGVVTDMADVEIADEQAQAGT